ncbi:MAG: APC family permease [Actinomycetota bacterium]|nr:APC family permease [Actinomycetota bacterium]
MQEAEAGPLITTSRQGLFVRNATGLVRELSAFDAFNLVFSAVLIPVGITQVMGFAPVFWPRGNMFLSFLIATPLVACFGLVYLYFTVLMPRSGGDYVWVSRTLSPFLGFVVNFSLTFVFLTWVAFNFTFMLATVGPAAAYVMGFHSSYLTAPSNGEMMIVSTILTALFAGLMILGVRAVARYMKVLFVVVWVGMAAWLIAMLVGSHSDFLANWQARTATPASSVVTQAHSLGFSAAGGIGWAATLFAMVYCFQVYTGFQWTGYFAGEIKNVRRTAVTSIIGGLLASAVIYMLGVGLIYRFFGFKFFGSVVFMGLGDGSSHWHMAFSPYLAALANFLPGPHWIASFIALCFVLAILWWTPTGFMLGTRNLFSWSFDRLAPAKLTEVSDRFHTPVVATVVIACVVEVLNYLNIYQGLGAYLLNIIAVMGFAFIVVSIAAAIAPWHRPTLHSSSPGWAQREIAGVPVITLVAIVSGLSWAFVIWTAFHTGFGGTFGAKPMLEAFTAPIIAIVYYIGIRLYRRSQGIELARTFAEIPPE